MADLSYEAALQRLGPALFPGEWIVRLTAREMWLLEQAGYFSSSIIPGRIFHGATEAGSARQRHEFMEWQRGKAGDWLDDHDIEVTERVGRSFVDKARFEAAFAKAFPRPSASVPTPPRRKGGNRAYADDRIVARVRKAVKSGEAKSFAEAIRALIAEIPGNGTPEAKIERIRRKAARPI